MARGLVYPYSDTSFFFFNRLIYTISYLKGLFVAFRYCELISMKLLNSKSSGSFSAADTVTEADATDAVYLFRTAYGSSAILYWTSASAVCVCTKDDHCVSQTIK